MCGILGFVNFEINGSKLEKLFLKQLYRGKNGFGYYNKKELYKDTSLENLRKILKNNKSNLFFIHNLLAINNFVLQPLESKKSIFLWNGEIYNWKELKEKYNIKAENDSELFHKLLDKFGIEILREINSDYSVCYYNKLNKKIYLFRDLIGIKPLFYNKINESLVFSSDKKTLDEFEVKELNSRYILIYDIESKLIKFKKRDFYTYSNKYINKEFILNKLEKLLLESIKKRVDGIDKVLVLFSGGIDSSLISFILKKLNKEFLCVTSGLKNSKDVEFSKRVAKYYNFKHKIVYLNEEIISKNIEEVKNIIDDINYVKNSVALPLHLALKDMKGYSNVVLSGLGSEEIFAGYKRFEQAEKEEKENKEKCLINKECLNGLLSLSERDLYRDDVISLKNNYEIRLPFLDKNLIEFSLNIDGKLKIKENNRKLILTELAKRLGYNKKFAERKKLAAQYGSGVDKILYKIAKKRGIKKSCLFH